MFTRYFQILKWLILAYPNIEIPYCIYFEVSFTKSTFTLNLVQLLRLISFFLSQIFTLILISFNILTRKLQKTDSF